MSILSPQQIAQLTLQVGLPANAAIVATAICLAESGGDTAARRAKGDGSIDRGLWQINNRAYPEIPDSAAYNAGQAARMMVAISAAGTNFRPWTSFVSGGYAAHLAVASAAVSGAIIQAGKDASSAVSNAVSLSNGGLGSGYGVMAEIAAWSGVIILLALLNSSRAGHTLVYDLLALAILLLIVINYKSVIEVFAPLLPLSTQTAVLGQDLSAQVA